MLDDPVLTRIRGYLEAELRPRDRTFIEGVRATINRITPTQGAMSGAAANACLDLGRGELQVRGGIIWNAVKRSYASLVGRDTPSVLEDLQQQIAEYLTTEAQTVANIAAALWRQNDQIFPWIYRSINGEARNELRERYTLKHSSTSTV